MGSTKFLIILFSTTIAFKQSNTQSFLAYGFIETSESKNIYGSGPIKPAAVDCFNVFKFISSY